jgi:uncharacterized protein YndB with AHSA1/START domain
MKIEASEASIETQIYIDAEPDFVFPYLVEPEKLVRWMGSEALIEPRPGGIYRVRINAADVMRGEYLQVEFPHRVVFSFGWEGENSPLPAGSTTVEVTLEALGGGTLVRLRQSGLPVPMQERQLYGWEHYLGRLKVFAEGEDPGPDPFAQSM